ncbi:hypothetical protein ALQ89_03139 [Pseudomonas amygdali pv. tabaci]|uniref:Uncharacterized protein n=2 Tax=Pseudomonas syringae group genomosp. 2 TaxID=251698 RepID=A0AAX1VSU2_PSEAJ|nr:hypothetical protein ALQ89_03139 [Pseudomonas amygdali pv. tabaci]
MSYSTKWLTCGCREEFQLFSGRLMPLVCHLQWRVFSAADGEFASKFVRECAPLLSGRADTLNKPMHRNVMKLDKKLAIARRNQDLGGAVLGVNNTHFAVLDPKRNIWWFDLPVPRLQVGQYEWLHLLLHTPEIDQLLHLKVTTVFMRDHMEGLEVRNADKRKPTVSLELSADKDSFLKDMRPKGSNLGFAAFLQK